MDKSWKQEPQGTFQAVNLNRETLPLTRAGRKASELLEDSGKCRQIIKQELNLHLLSDSLFSEQQKLRHVLDWTHSFLSSDSEVHHEFCRADSLILADEDQRVTETKSPAYKLTPASGYHHPVYCTAGGNEEFGGEVMKVWHLEPSRYESSESNNSLYAFKPHFSDNPCIPLSFIPRRDEVTWPECRETLENIKDGTNKQTPSQDNRCGTNNPFKSGQRQHTHLSDRNTNQMPASESATGLIEESASCCSSTPHKKSMVHGTVSNMKLSYKTAESGRDISGPQIEVSKEKVQGKTETWTEVVRMGRCKGKVNEDQDSSPALSAHVKSCNSEPQMTHEQMEKTTNRSCICHLTIPTALTVYEQYQLCVNQLHHLRERQTQHMELKHFLELPAKERKTTKETAAPAEAPALPVSGFEFNSSTSPENKKCLNKRVTAAKERSLDAINNNQDGSEHSRRKATVTEQGVAKHCDNLTMEETPASICAESRPVCQTNTNFDPDVNKCGELSKGNAGGITSNDKIISMEQLRNVPGDNVPGVEETATLAHNTGIQHHIPRELNVPEPATIV